MRSLSELWPGRHQSSRPPKTVFVLSGGAAMGAAQVGMLRALLERRILPDLILGCSIGALNGVVLASGPNLETVGRMQDVWMDLIGREIVPTGRIPSPVQLLRKGEAISSNDGLRELIADVIPETSFGELEVPFACVATNIDDATEHWFDRGDLAPAVLASASIPAVFPPVEIDGVHYLDGAIVDDVPVTRAVELGATRIFVLQVGGIDRPRPESKRPIDVAFLAYWIARRHRLVEDLARIPDDVEVVLLPHGNQAPVRFNDLSASAHLMDVAYRASSAHLDARIEGRIEAVTGPVRESVLQEADATDRSDGDDERELAKRVFATARSMMRRGEARRAEDDDMSEDVDEPEPAATESPREPSSDGEAPVDGPAEVEDVRGDAGEPGEARRRLVERAEALGPAMRALVDRVLDRGDPTDDHEAPPGVPDTELDSDQEAEK